MSLVTLAGGVLAAGGAGQQGLIVLGEGQQVLHFLGVEELRNQDVTVLVVLGKFGGSKGGRGCHRNRDV